MEVIVEKVHVQNYYSQSWSKTVCSPNLGLKTGNEVLGKRLVGKKLLLPVIGVHLLKQRQKFLIRIALNFLSICGLRYQHGPRFFFSVDNQYDRNAVMLKQR